MTGVRITHGMMSDRLLNDVRRSNAEIARTSSQVTSQKRIQTASDDAVGTGQALRTRTDLAEIDANIAGAQTAAGWTGAADTALGSLTDLIHRTRELVLQAGNDTLKASDRASIAGELTQLKEQMKSIGNAKFGDAFIFAGQNSGTAPYTSGSDAYGGDALPVTRMIGPGQTVQVNVPGGTVLGGTPGDGKLLDTMNTAIAFLNGGTAADANSLRTTTLTALTTNLDQVVTARSTLGATQNRVTLAESRLEDTKLLATGRLSEIEDADYAESLVKLSTQQTAYQAALNAGAKVIQPSLMDFLR
ncbi:MAG: flagellar hook-associated protein FlgL [Solirubrobacteraceae bacterium]|nr:flagellar hook-associated protein FlgL [Solirubrobacteraceae bacterium]